jgi:hypothetical protein
MMKRFVPIWVLAMLALTSMVSAEEPGEAKTATTSTKPAESATPAEEKVPAQPVEEEDDSNDDVWSSKYDELDHVMVLERIDGKADNIQRKIAALEHRVGLLRESVIVGSITPSRTLIVHKNELGSSFEIQSLEYKLDGEPVFARSVKEGGINVPDRFELLDGVLAPGEHLLETRIQLRGTGLGYFSYFKGYRFRLGSKYRLNVAEGRLTKLTIVAYPRPDMSLKPKERLAIKYDVDVTVNNAN